MDENSTARIIKAGHLEKVSRGNLIIGDELAVNTKHLKYSAATNTVR